MFAESEQYHEDLRKGPFEETREKANRRASFNEEGKLGVFAILSRERGGEGWEKKEFAGAKCTSGTENIKR